MKNATLKVVGALVIALAMDARAQVNSWTNSAGGKWEIVRPNWSAGVLPTNNTSVFFTNATTKTVTVDASTVLTNNLAGNNCLTITNLIVSGPSGTVNTQQLVGTTTPLHILNNFTISTGGHLLVGPGGKALVDVDLTTLGTMTVSNGELIATNSAFSTAINGQSTVNGTTSTQTLAAVIINAGGTLSLSAGLLTFQGPISTRLGTSVGNTGTVWVTGGQLVSTNSPMFLGFATNTVARMAVSNGVWLATNVAVAAEAGSQGTLTIAGGTNAMLGPLVAGSLNATGTVWVTGGQLVITNAPSLVGAGSGFIIDGSVTLTNGSSIIVSNVATVIGNRGSGSLTVFGGSMSISNVTVGNLTGSQGALSVTGGIATLSGTLTVGSLASATGAVWMSGGQLTATNSDIYIGKAGIGQMTVSNGTWMAAGVQVGELTGSQGTLTVAGGTNMISGSPSVDGLKLAGGTVWVSGGQLLATNNLNIFRVGASGFSGRMTVSNGTCHLRNVFLPGTTGSSGTLTIAGGTTTVASSMFLGGVSGCNETGVVTVVGGELNVTNALGSGRLVVESGTLTLSAGTLRLDNLVITNSCGRFLITGGAPSIAFTNILANLDADGDGLANSWETSFGLSPFSDTGNDGASGDPDGDGFTNLQEFNAGTNPTLASSTPTFNSWNVTPSGKWEDGLNWALHTPPATNVSSIFVTNATTKTITIDAKTVLSNAANECLTVSNLIASAPAGAANTLQLTNSGSFPPLHVLNSLTISSGGAVLVTNAAVRIDGGLVIDAATANASLTVRTNGVVALVGPVTIGGGAGATGIVTVAGGLVVTNIPANGSGSGLVIDGSLVLTNGGLIICTNVNAIIGNGGSGSLTMSGGSMLVSNLILGNLSGAFGTLTVSAGSNTVLRTLTVGSQAFSCQSTGSVNVLGGGLFITNNAHTAVLDVQTGTVQLDSGTLTIDHLQMLAPCGRFRKTGGTLSITATNLHGSYDADGDGMANSWEQTYGLKPLDFTDADNDPDGDGFTNLQEFNGQSDPTNAVSTPTFTSWNIDASGKWEVSTNWSAGLPSNTVQVTIIRPGVEVTIDAATTNVPGTMTVSNLFVADGTLFMNNAGVATPLRVNGLLSVARELVRVNNSALTIGQLGLGEGTVVLESGLLETTTNSLAFIGGQEGGVVIVSNGTWRAGSLAVAQDGVRIAGGVTLLAGSLTVRTDEGNGIGSVVMTGGQLVVTNGAVDIGGAEMIVSNGTWLAGGVMVGSFFDQGFLQIAGGTSSVFSNLTLGDFDCMITGLVDVVGGELNVTNALTNATLEVRTGILTLGSGTLRVNRLVMTNSCASFVRTGGTLVYGTAVLDPARDDDGDGISNGYEQSHGLDPLNAADATLDTDGDGQTNLAEFQSGTDATNSLSSLRITAITKESNDLRVTWMTGIGKTNALERTAGVVGSFATNNFALIFSVTNTVGNITNYLDAGAATSSPSFYYRVRLVP